MRQNFFSFVCALNELILASEKYSTEDSLNNDHKCYKGKFSILLNGV